MHRAKRGLLCQLQEDIFHLPLCGRRQRLQPVITEALDPHGVPPLLEQLRDEFDIGRMIAIHPADEHSDLADEQRRVRPQRRAVEQIRELREELGPQIDLRFCRVVDGSRDTGEELLRCGARSLDNGNVLSVIIALLVGRSVRADRGSCSGL